ncbi:unnamed protein product [Arabis nemorensis]|uniref:Uncharacterized protein n=1 Tax=Arabis nemorensis TaxID=586526 RepID=A0A565B6E6_9BRAS|nr:unnamed protein product [Arabis nemorensis]
MDFKAKDFKLDTATPTLSGNTKASILKDINLERSLQPMHTLDSGHNKVQTSNTLLVHLKSHQLKLMDRFAQVASSSQRAPSTLPGKYEANPKETCNVTLSEDERKEESNEAHMQEETEDDMDTDEILPATTDEKFSLKTLL